MAERGTISIHAENIMPVIKKWLYSDKDIFVREMVSNASDAISKHKRLVAAGEASGYRSTGEGDYSNSSQHFSSFYVAGRHLWQDDVAWFDAAGMEIRADSEAWTPLVLHGYETRTLQGVAPHPSARAFKVKIRR